MSNQNNTKDIAMTAKKFNTIILIYIFIAVVTFGHAANNEDLSGGAGLGSSMFWPFYWSWNIQR